MIHALKTKQPYFAKVADGSKTFEIRNNDRDFKVGDVIILKEWDEKTGYSGQYVEAVITYVTDFAQNHGYCVFSFAKQQPAAPDSTGSVGFKTVPIAPAGDDVPNIPNALRPKVQAYSTYSCKLFDEKPAALPDTTALIRQIAEALDKTCKCMGSPFTDAQAIEKFQAGAIAAEALSAAQAYLDGKAPPREDVNQKMLDTLRNIAEATSQADIREYATDAIKAAEQKLKEQP